MAYAGLVGAGRSAPFEASPEMEPNFFLLLVIAAAVGLLAAIVILFRQSHERREAERENPFATSTEGEKICPHCGGANLWTDATCIYCKGRLAG